jgi:hypothetical protein
MLDSQVGLNLLRMPRGRRRSYCAWIKSGVTDRRTGREEADELGQPKASRITPLTDKVEDLRHQLQECNLRDQRSCSLKASKCSTLRLRGAEIQDRQTKIHQPVPHSGGRSNSLWKPYPAKKGKVKTLTNTNWPELFLV